MRVRLLFCAGMLLPAILLAWLAIMWLVLWWLVSSVVEAIGVGKHALDRLLNDDGLVERAQVGALAVAALLLLIQRSALHRALPPWPPEPSASV